MNTIQANTLLPLDNPFNFSNIDIRTAIDADGEGWFCAKDVFLALEIAWKGSNSLKNVPEKRRMVRYYRTSQGPKETIFLNEPGVFQVVLTSRKPEAQRFADWVYEEVLPSIRRQGFYGSATAGQQIALRTQKLKLLEKLCGTRDAFVAESVMTSLRSVCNALGEPMPDVNLLGQDRDQLPLAGV